MCYAVLVVKSGGHAPNRGHTHAPACTLHCALEWYKRSTADTPARTLLGLVLNFSRVACAHAVRKVRRLRRAPKRMRIRCARSVLSTIEKHYSLGRVPTAKLSVTRAIQSQGGRYRSTGKRQFNRRLYTPESSLYIMDNFGMLCWHVFLMAMRLNPAYTHALVRRAMLDTVQLLRSLPGPMRDEITFIPRRAGWLELLYNAGLDSSGVCVCPFETQPEPRVLGNDDLLPHTIEMTMLESTVGDDAPLEDAIINRFHARAVLTAMTAKAYKSNAPRHGNMIISNLTALS